MSADPPASAAPSAAAPPAWPARPKTPYPGLRPFEAGEWSIFFGRETMIDEVIDRLAAHRLVLVHGSSGAGKSSLVRAGVLPKLARQYRRAGVPWQTGAMRPSGGPLWNLAKELARLDGGGSGGEDADRIGAIVGEFSRRGATLSSVAGSLKNLQGRPLCLLVDQFEELFRFEKETSREEAELFADLLVRSAAEADGAADAAGAEGAAVPVHVVVTMRSEFLGECARFSGLAETINRTQYLVPRMEREALLRAIRRPAQLYGGEVTLDLAERLVADAAGREDELPLIQHGLMLMWHDAAAKVAPGSKTVLDAAPLEAAGGLSRMLSAHADEAVDAAAPDAERRFAVERLFRALTDVNVEGNAIRRPQAFHDLVAVAGIEADKLRGIVEELRRDGVSFLTPYAPAPIADNTMIDIGHEALIRCWDRLSDPQKGWLKREFDDGLVWRSLVVEAQGFERNRRHVLSPATTDERRQWWRERKVNDTWAARYGGHLALVERLLAASRRAASRQRLLLYAFNGLAGVVMLGLAWINRAAIADEWRSLTVAWPYERADVWPYLLRPSVEEALKAGASFRECTAAKGTDYCPEMVVVPAGSFMMGASAAEKGVQYYAQEIPQHKVTIAKPFAVSKYEVTFAEWDTCASYGDCATDISDDGFGRGQRPVINVTWDEARTYVKWLSKVTGKSYRLLSEAEYEYAARGGKQTIYPWGNEIKLNGQAMANCDGCGSKWDNNQTAPVGSFPPNEFGLYDMVGNVWEWTQDCYHNSYNRAPINGSAWLTGGNCISRVFRGGSRLDFPDLLRSASRFWGFSGFRVSYLGFRVARTLLTP